MQTDRVEYPINSGYIQIVAEGHVLAAFWAHPDTGGTFPGVVLIHDYWGLTAHIRRLVRRLAETGRYVIAPDLFDRRQPATLDEGRQQAAALGETGPPYIAAAIRALETHHHCNGDVAVVGFGMGGALALHMAVHRDDLEAAVLFDAETTPYHALLPAARTPILAFYGETGGLSPENRAALEAQLKAASPENAVVVYPEAGRGFFDESRPEHVPAAAGDAWTRMLNFLAGRLTGPSEPPGIRQKTY